MKSKFRSNWSATEIPPVSLIYMLVDRAIKLDHKKFHNENLDLIRNILVKNHYPSEFIEKYDIKKNVYY